MSSPIGSNRNENLLVPPSENLEPSNPGKTVAATTLAALPVLVTHTSGFCSPSGKRRFDQPRPDQSVFTVTRRGDYTGSPRKRGSVCPSAPKKVRPSCTQGKHLITQTTPFSIQKWIDKSVIMLTPIQELGKGEHGTAWLVEMPDKSKAVYKVDKTSNNSHVKEELYQYAQLKSIGFPVAMHYDLEPFIQMTEFQAIFADTDKISRDRKLLEFVSQYVTHGYHLREYVENSFPSYKSTPIDSPLYDQVKKMMETAFKNKIAVDLQRMNVGYQMVERVPKVIYYDLMPHDEVDLDTRGMVREDVNPFGIIVKACLQTFAPVDHEIYAKLDPTISSPLL